MDDHEKKSLWWLSFADEDKCRGIVITEAVDVVDAAAKCWRLGINPGGQVMGILMGDGWPEREYPHDTLLSEEWVMEQGNKKLKDLPDELLHQMIYEDFKGVEDGRH